MTVLAFQDLWGDVVGCATDRALLLAIVLQLGCQAKISNLHAYISIKEEVSKLEISVNDATPMQVFQCHDQLVQVEHGLWLGQPLAGSLAHEFVQSLVRAHLEDDVDVLTVLEVVVEVNDLVMIQTTVNRDLGSELRMCPWLRNGGLGYNLGGKDFLGFHVLHFVALGKSTLAKEASLVVPGGQTILPSRTGAVLDHFNAMKVAV